MASAILLALLWPTVSLAADCSGQRTSNDNPTSKDLASALLQDLPNVCNGGSPQFPPLSNTTSTFNSGQEVWNISRTDPSVDVSACNAAFTNIIVQCISDPSQTNSPGSWGGSWSSNGASFTLSNPGTSNPIAGFYNPDLSDTVNSAGRNVASMNSDPSNPDWAAAAAILFLSASTEATALSLPSLALVFSSAASVAMSARQAPGPQAAESLASAFSSASSAQATPSPATKTSPADSGTTTTSTSPSPNDGPTTTSTSTSSIVSISTPTSSISSSNAGPTTTSSISIPTISTTISTTSPSSTSTSTGTSVTTGSVDPSITFPISLDACPLYTPEWTTTDPVSNTTSSITSTTSSTNGATSTSTSQASSTALPTPGCDATPFNAIISSAGYNTNAGVKSVNDLLYSLRQVLCSNDCTYPPNIPTADAYVYPQAGSSSASQGECELSIGLQGGIEVFAYRHTAATGVQQQDCWDALDSVIKNCVRGRQAQGWINGANYEFFKTGVRTNNDPEALHPQDFYHGHFNYLTAGGKGGSVGSFVDAGLQG